MYGTLRRWLVSLLTLSFVILFVGKVRSDTDPAPDEDRVGFPEGYRENFKQLFVFDRFDNHQVRVVYGNDQAASAQPGEAFPYGSIMAMETYRAKLNENGEAVLDENGRYQRGDLTAIFVMRKEQGFGEAYQQNRTGEWEYVAYKPDAEHSFQTPPKQSASCARCHLQATAAKDWAFRMSLYSEQASGAIPQGLMQHYRFVPTVITVKPGSTVTWYNDDEVAHDIVATDASFQSGELTQGASFVHTFPEKGVFEFVCKIHPTMKGKIIVVEP
jgi:plastocyanin